MSFGKLLVVQPRTKNELLTSSLPLKEIHSQELNFSNLTPEDLFQKVLELFENLNKDCQEEFEKELEDQVDEKSDDSDVEKDMKLFGSSDDDDESDATQIMSLKNKYVLSLFLKPQLSGFPPVMLAEYYCCDSDDVSVADFFNTSTEITSSTKDKLLSKFAKIIADAQQQSSHNLISLYIVKSKTTDTPKFSRMTVDFASDDLFGGRGGRGGYNGPRGGRGRGGYGDGLFDDTDSDYSDGGYRGRGRGGRGIFRGGRGRGIRGRGAAPNIFGDTSDYSDSPDSDDYRRPAVRARGRVAPRMVRRLS